MAGPPARALRNLAVLIYAATVELSILQVFLLMGAYAPVGFILTTSDMPYLPPMSMVVLLPYIPPNYSGWAAAEVPLSLWGVEIYAPVVHSFAVGATACYEYIPNAKAAFGLSPLETARNMILGLLPPWIPLERPCVYRPVYAVAFAVPAWAYIPLMAFALRYKLYYRFKRVW